MAFRTLTQIRLELQKACDIEEESFVPDAEILNYINEGIADAAAEICTLNEDYFEAETTIDLVSGTSEYALPSGIYADKIRGVEYVSGDQIYPIRKISPLNRMDQIWEIKTFGGSGYYEYQFDLINNSSTAGVKFVLLPPARATESGTVKIKYIREPNVLSSDSDVCDIPERFYYYVLQFAKIRIYEKEKNPLLPAAAAALERWRQRMVDTLSNRIPNDQTEVPIDFQFYYDSV